MECHVRDCSKEPRAESAPKQNPIRSLSLSRLVFFEEFIKQTMPVEKMLQTRRLVEAKVSQRVVVLSNIFGIKSSTFSHFGEPLIEGHIIR